MPLAKMLRIAPELPSRNLQESIEYYEQKLGFALAAIVPGGDYAIVERDGVAIHIFEDPTGAQSSVGLHIFTAGLEDLHAELVRRGAQISQHIAIKPWGNREFRVLDNAGNVIKFTEPLPNET